jgi:thioredoxin-related protein
LVYGAAFFGQNFQMFYVRCFFLVITAYSFPSPSSAAELIMFESEGCEWCEVWDEEIGAAYAKTSEAIIVPLRRIDIDDVHHTNFKHLKGLIYTPTFVVIDNGKELGRITGYPGEDFFWQFLNEILVNKNLN